MPKRCLNPLPLMLVLLLPPLRVLPTEAMLEDFADRLERHPFDVRVEEDDEQPADEADPAVEAESSGGSDAFHHAEESAFERERELVSWYALLS